MKKGIILAIMIYAATALAAGTCTVSTQTRESYRDITWSWTSDASGVVSGQGGIAIYGIIDSLFFDADNNATPTNLYDVQLRTDAGENVISDGAINYGDDVPVAKSSPLRRRQPLDRNGDYIRLWGETITPYIKGAGPLKSGVIKIRVW